MSSPADFSVDLDTLTALRSELGRLITAIDDLRTPPGSTEPETMGGADVADAVDRFVGRWRAGRLEIVEHLSACEEVVELAIAGYGETDDRLRCAVEPALPKAPAEARS